jgi:hypothetical protein
MHHAQCVVVNGHPSVTVALDVHTHIVCGEIRVWVGIHRFCICLTEQTL